MINFSDNTMLESGGQYEDTKKLMESEGPPGWMIRTDAFVNSKSVAAMYVVHAYDGGKMYVYETERPQTTEIPDDDIRELFSWCGSHGWELYVHDRLIQESQAYEFWMRMFRSGLVKSDELAKDEQEEIERFQNFGMLEDE